MFHEAQRMLSEVEPKETLNWVFLWYNDFCMYFVYILCSRLDNRYYYGLTDRDPMIRLRVHNKSTASGYTKKYQPWFEATKRGSGAAFARKRLI